MERHPDSQIIRPSIHPPSEALEPRRLLAGSLDGGILLVEGTAGNDLIIVGIRDGRLRVKINGEVETFRLGAVDSLRFYGRGGNDEIRAELDIKSRTYGGVGDDTLLGGDRRDLLDGGVGDDVLSGGAADDRLVGDDGIDELLGRGGRDFLDGGSHADRLSGGGGADEARGGDGADRIHGDASDDSLVGGAGDDRLFGDDGIDVLRGKLGDDLLDGGADPDIYDRDEVDEIERSAEDYFEDELEIDLDNLSIWDFDDVIGEINRDIDDAIDHAIEDAIDKIF